MNSGKIFEQNIKKSVDTSKIYYQRIKDNPSSFGQDGSKVRFTLDNPYDSFCFYEQTFFALELKSTKGTSFSIQKEKKEPKKMIKYNQIVGLTEASKYKGIYAGFLFNFEDKGAYWLNIENFNLFLKENDKKSINLADIVKYQGIPLERHILKVNYRYDFEELLATIIHTKGAKING